MTQELAKKEDISIDKIPAALVKLAREVEGDFEIFAEEAAYDYPEYTPAQLREILSLCVNDEAIEYQSGVVTDTEKSSALINDSIYRDTRSRWS